MINKNDVVKIHVRHEGDQNTDWKITFKDGSTYSCMSIGQGSPEDGFFNTRLDDEMIEWLWSLPNFIIITDDIELEYDLNFRNGKFVGQVPTYQATIPFCD
jgi:hypothetical protein